MPSRRRRGSLLERADVESLGRAPDLHEVTEDPVDLRGIGDDGEDSHGAARNKAAGKTFIEFLMKKESNMTWITEGGKVPTQKSIIGSAEFKNAELLTPFAKMGFRYFPKTKVAGATSTALAKAWLIS